MTRTFALLLIAAAAACSSSGSKGRAQQSQTDWAPKFERAKALFEVRDEKGGARVGFVEKTTYDDGSVVYWVTDVDRKVRHGYMTANNRGYRYDWVAGVRSESAEFIGADTFQANARKILGYGRPVVLNEIAWEDLLKEYQAPADGGKKE
jgi:hypothetical protein